MKAQRGHVGVRPDAGRCVRGCPVPGSTGGLVCSPSRAPRDGASAVSLSQERRLKTAEPGAGGGAGGLGFAQLSLVVPGLGRRGRCGGEEPRVVSRLGLVVPPGRRGHAGRQTRGSWAESSETPRSVPAASPAPPRREVSYVLGGRKHSAPEPATRL